MKGMTRKEKLAFLKEYIGLQDEPEEKQADVLVMIE